MMSPEKKHHLIWGVVAVVVVALVLWQQNNNPPPVPLPRVAMQERGVSTMAMPVSEVAFVGKSAMVAADSAPAANFGGGDDSSQRLIVKTGNVSMVVKNVRNTIADITSLANEVDGFVVRSSVRESKGDIKIPSGSITVRVPAQEFEKKISDIKKLSIKVVSENVGGRDVTEESIDLEARLKNLQAAEAQFLKIFDRAGEIKDVLAVQRELNSVRNQIESLQARMKYLKQSADLSTITVALSTDEDELPVIDKEDKWRPGVVFKNAVRSLVDFGKEIVNRAIWVLVFAPVWGAVIVVLLVWRRRQQRKQ